MGILIDVLILLVGYIIGIFTMALCAISSKEDAINEGYQIGYEKGKNKGLDIAIQVVNELAEEYKEVESND